MYSKEDRTEHELRKSGPRPTLEVGCIACLFYPIGYDRTMRPVRFLGDLLKCLPDFPEGARPDAGYQLDKVQRGHQPDDFEPMPVVGNGVEEICVSSSRA